MPGFLNQPMRLTEHEIKAIINNINIFIKEQHAKLYLFGSRVNNQAKGGDIDLLLIVNNESEKFSLLQLKPEILVAIKNAIGEQRIDLKIAGKSELQSDTFLRSIFPQAILLHSY